MAQWEAPREVLWQGEGGLWPTQPPTAAARQGRRRQQPATVPGRSRLRRRSGIETYTAPKSSVGMEMQGYEYLGGEGWQAESVMFQTSWSAHICK